MGVVPSVTVVSGSPMVGNTAANSSAKKSCKENQDRQPAESMKSSHDYPFPFARSRHNGLIGNGPEGRGFSLPPDVPCAVIPETQAGQQGPSDGWAAWQIL